MGQHCILTIDVGTSSTKTAVWSAAGQALAEASASYSLQRPNPLWAEIDPAVWWQAVCRTIQQVMNQAGLRPDNVGGIGLDAVGWTLVPVDREVTPLAPAMIWLDRRAGEETAWLSSLPAANSLVQLVANPIDEAYITPKLLWLQRHRSQVFDAAHQFLAASGYIAAKFTGEFSCDYSQAYGYHFFDINKGRAMG